VKFDNREENFPAPIDRQRNVNPFLETTKREKHFDNESRGQITFGGAFSKDS
jgi:hypothetical protein